MGGLHADEPLVGELSRVGDQIQEDLADAPLVGDDRRQVGGYGLLEFDGLVLDQRDGGGHHPADDLLQVHWPELQFHLAGLDLGDVQDIVDQAQEVLTAVVDGLQVLPLHIGDRTVDPLEDDAGEADDGVERGPQFVGHVGQELALEPVHLLEPLRRLDGLSVQPGVLPSDAEVRPDDLDEL